MYLWEKWEKSGHPRKTQFFYYLLLFIVTTLLRIHFCLFRNYRTWRHHTCRFVVSIDVVTFVTRKQRILWESPRPLLPTCRINKIKFAFPSSANKTRRALHPLAQRATKLTKTIKTASAALEQNSNARRMSRLSGRTAKILRRTLHSRAYISNVLLYYDDTFCIPGI